MHAALLLLAITSAHAQVPKEVGLSWVSTTASDLVDKAEDVLLTRWLKRHAQLWQFLAEPSLTQAEFDDLLARAPQDLQELLQTRGYFNAVVQVLNDKASPELAITLGPVTTIGAVKIEVVDAEGTEMPQLRQEISENWSLKVGQAFSQSAWQSAKDQALSSLSEQDYYQATIASSQAQVDPRTQRADLTLRLNTGAAFAFGPLRVSGLQHYGAQELVNLARFEGLREGLPYRSQALFEVQRRIIDTGKFSSAFVTLTPVEPAPDSPANGPAVLAVGLEVGERPLKQTEASIGFSTDSGPRLHLSHTHHRTPLVGWTAVNTVDWQRDSQWLSSNWLSPLDARAWQWTGGLEIKHQVDDDITTSAQNWRVGETQSLNLVQRTYYFQLAQAKEQVRGQAAETTSAFSGHLAWSRSRWDDLTDPQSGHALSVDLSAGLTLSQGTRPYLRGQTQWLWLQPFENPKIGRLATRAGLGAVLASQAAQVPSSELFLTGGDTSVRGYGVRSIGRSDGAQTLVLPGRLMWLGSLEWQRPTTWGGDFGRIEQTLFIDAAAVSDRVAQQSVFVGTGTGIRLLSPVGPMQADLAYGHKTKEWRLHLFVGIRF